MLPDPGCGSQTGDRSHTVMPSRSSRFPKFDIVPCVRLHDSIGLRSSTVASYWRTCSTNGVNMAPSGGQDLLMLRIVHPAQR